MANTNFNSFGRGTVISDQATYDAGLRAHMIRVYNYMASGLALSGIVAVGLFSSAELAGLFFQVAPGGRVVGLNALGWVAIFAPLGLLLLVGFRAAQMSVGAVQAVYWAVTALMGVSLSLVLFRYTGASVARTFFVTCRSLREVVAAMARADGDPAGSRRVATAHRTGTLRQHRTHETHVRP